MKNSITFNLIVFMFLFSISCKAQIQPDATSLNQKILGSWIPEGSNFDNRLVFNNDGSAEKFSDGQLYINYTWSINKELVNGVPFNTLILDEVGNSETTNRYEINTLKDNLLILVFQRPSGGISGLNKYFKQE
ncbi:hypothetical protein [Flavobacterium sp. CS20]|uniref:hypothetical protein n=1 Tax=Flavobacterium sp. CS20 TaxID=2775246 RepID=UPI001B3A5CBC|nr:hypothetical protein [Flavobacterium sp. CS20]QTY25935.1 hypothetical protein IGB25_07845 [Flavobacterium sp. CS20]